MDKNVQDDNKKIKVELDKHALDALNSQKASSDITISTKSEGNTPSGLDAIKKNQMPNGLSSTNSRSNLNRPIADGKNRSTNDPDISLGESNENGTRKKKGYSSHKKVGKTSNKALEKEKKLGVNQPNSFLNRNNFKGFGRNKTAKNPSINPSASFKGKTGFLNKKSPFMPKGLSMLSKFQKKKKSNSISSESVKKVVTPNIISWFMALPIQIKIAIVGGGVGSFIIIVVILIMIVTSTSASEANREMKNEYIEGDYTDEELCEYLDRNGYLSNESGEVIECEKSQAYQYFYNFKTLKEDYEEKYSRNQIQINTELLYETLAYYNTDEELYTKATKDEMNKLMEAMIEEVEESCVVKTYNKDTKVCTENKYVYTLYEFSLDKYISYLKFGNTSTHPNYGHDSKNKSSNGKAVTRKCGEGKNVDYVFGYGLVNTSSSPISQSSNCPNNPVTEDDYDDEDINVVKTSLKDLGVLGGVTPYSHVNYSSKASDDVSESDSVGVTGSGDGATIAEYALKFVGNPYKYGGTSLTNGADCSGFIQSVYAHFGYKISRSTSTQVKDGKEVECNLSSLKAGDIILYGNPVGHAALYIGNGMVVHAKGAKWGITTDKYDYSSKGFNTCRRIVE